MPHSIYPVPPPPGSGRTILVQGNGGPALALWAAGLARRADPAFAWADIAPSPPGRDKVVRLLMARSSEGAWINGVTGEDLLPPELSDAAIARLLGTAGGRPLSGRLERYLGLPALLQLLAARSTRQDGTATIVVLGTEALGPAQLAATLGSVEVHSELRREGITSLFTFEGTASEPLASLFDQVYEVLAPAPEEWARSRVRAVRGDDLPEELRSARALRAQWARLALPPELLATWSLPGSTPVRPR